MKPHIRFILATIILSVCLLFVYKQILFPPEKIHTPKDELPSQILEWNSAKVVFDKEVLSVLNSDKIIYRSYYKNGGPPISIFIAYYDTLEKTDFSHSPIVCLTGQGWQIEKITEKEIPISLSNPSKIRVNQMIQQKSDTTMVALYWYQSPDHAYSNRGVQKLSLFMDRLLGKHDNNAFISLNFIVPSGMPTEKVNVYLNSFVQALYPEIKRVLFNR